MEPTSKKKPLSTTAATTKRKDSRRTRITSNSILLVVVICYSFFVISMLWTEYDQPPKNDGKNNVEADTTKVEMITIQNSDPDDNDKVEADFTITVLTMNRVTSLQRLLESLEATNYDNDFIDLVIKIDHSPTNDHDGTVACAKAFNFTHGRKRVIVATQNLGLARSWFYAWTPKHTEDYGVILEDDLEVASDVWYLWLKKAWSVYGGKDDHASEDSSLIHDLGGISLNRQTLVPQKPNNRMEEIVNNHKPFLYPLVGSYGFSPHPVKWAQFISWIDEHGIDNDLNTLDVSTPDLITSDWWNNVDKRHMWTQHFIYFTKKHNLFILYVNLPNEKTLVSHMREKGEHYAESEGRDFELATSGSGTEGIDMDFPEYKDLSRFDWDAKPIKVS